jgi:hypothetical protein
LGQKLLTPSKTERRNIQAIDHLQMQLEEIERQVETLNEQILNATLLISGEVDVSGV